VLTAPPPLSNNTSNAPACGDANGAVATANPVIRISAGDRLDVNWPRNGQSVIGHLFLKN
jgi:hypothetical protein